MPVREPSWRRSMSGAAGVVVRFYLGVALVGFVWHAVAQDSNDVWRAPPGSTGASLLTGPAIGLVMGLGVVQLFRGLELYMRWLPELHHEFRAVLGRLERTEVFILAAASALGEEILFRGAMLDAWGLSASTVVFALVHIPPRRNLWPWTLSAGVLGWGLGELTLATGDLGAAVTAHFVINLLNLTYITTRLPRARVEATAAGPVLGGYVGDVAAFRSLLAHPRSDALDGGGPMRPASLRGTRWWALPRRRGG
ncbi:MAG: CPBP family intramembrane metalloprotease [Myxococcales bacterium FL481]|nr:MAG: CPBP family intramembrane metalloprotease [Myxococcales bacterium FL481]